MAAEKKESAKAGRVELFIPRGSGKEDPNVFISVNGVNYLLPRGKKSSVPEHVAEEYYRSQRAEEAMHAKIDEMTAAAQS